MPQAPTSAWLPFVLLTIANWGLYGVFLHKGNALMGDPANGRMKAFLFVGLAYFLVAVLAPLALLLISRATWSFTGGGVVWSLIAGTVGAIGALGVLLAFGGGGVPSVVMSLIFAGAPIVNAVVAITMAGQWKQVNAPFIAGILIAALGAYMVVTYKPAPAKHPQPPAAEQVSLSTDEHR